MKHFKEIIYISELNLPNISAQSLQTLKMCSAFASNYKTKLFVFFCNKKFNYFKKNYLLKNKFDITGLFNSSKKHNLLVRLIFFYKLFFLFKNKKKSLFITRSVLISLFLSLSGIKNILEIHIENYGITKLLFKIKFFFFKSKNQKFILISKNLNKVFKFQKKDFIVLDDASDIENFKIQKKSNLETNSCIYIGSFFKGKSIEIIKKISKRMVKTKFYLYGNDKIIPNDQKKKFTRNAIFCGYTFYRKIPNLLSKHKVCLMPYSKKTFINADKISNEKYISPLKLFDYLASGKILIASKMSGYSHILKNKKNCFLVNPDKIDDWVKTIQYVFKNYSKLNHIRSEARETAKFYNWNKRAQCVIKFAKFL